VLSATEAWKAVEARADVLRPEATSREDFMRECHAGRFDGVVALYRAAVSVAGRLDGEMVAALPPSVRFVCYTGKFFRWRIVGQVR
jgi:glyoxylate reductase